MIVHTSTRCLARVVCIGALFLSAQGAFATAGGTRGEPAESGVPCRGSPKLHDNGRVESCTLSGDALVSGQALPSGTRVFLDREGRLDSCFLSRHTQIDGHVCKGRGHGYQTTFHPNGRLDFCNLAEPERIQGVLCQKSNFFIWTFVGNAGVRFHDNGRLRGCLLAADVDLQGRSFKKGERVELDRNGDLVPLEDR